VTTRQAPGHLTTHRKGPRIVTAETTTAPQCRTAARENVIRAALRALSAERAEPHAHSADEHDYAAGQLDLAARDLANATYAVPADQQPPGWCPRSDGPGTDLPGTIRRSPDGRMLAVLWPYPPHRARWMVTGHWGSCGYEPDATVATWPVAGVMPFSPAAGCPLTKPGNAEAAR